MAGGGEGSEGAAPPRSEVQCVHSEVGQGSGRGSSARGETT